MTTFRSLALLAAHRDHANQARQELAAQGRAAPMLRATVLESLRLWPTTPLVLRETTRETRWRNGVMPADTGVIVFAPYFHRDETSVPFANRFAPDIWTEGEAHPRWPFIPFSDGPAICPGRHLVLLLTTAMLGELLQDGGFRLKDQRMQPGRLPATLNHLTLRFVAA